jgi:hypothetical protein
MWLFKKFIDVPIIAEAGLAHSVLSIVARLLDRRQQNRSSIPDGKVPSLSPPFPCQLWGLSSHPTNGSQEFSPRE